MGGATRHAGLAAVAWALLISLSAETASAQQPTGQPSSGAILEFPNLGPIPGSTESALGAGPGAFQGGIEAPGVGVLGNRKRGGRIPKPGKGGRGDVTAAPARHAALALPETLPEPQPQPLRPAAPATATLDVDVLDDEGPPTGLTLDEAIERMMRANLDIRALRHELPQADADILTAGLRTNPLIYMDSQFIPYGAFNDSQPGGPTQYDVNITYPLDVSRKRQARVVVARIAKSSLEAQFQDVVRRQLSNLHTAFVNLQSARLAERSVAAAVRRQEVRLDELRRAADAAEAAGRDRIAQESLMLEQSRLALADAGDALADAQEGLAVLLNEPPATTGRLQPRGGIRDTFPPPPPLEELTRLSLACRPDIRALRVGVERANAEVALQRANRFDDVFLFYDPITIQDFGPYGRSNATSWAAGITCPLPIWNRNQGNIARATSNVQQTRQELSSIERRVISEVRLAEREYLASQRAIEQMEATILPLAKAKLARRTDQFARDEISFEDYESSQEDAAGIVQAYREALVRHRRAMLDLNTAVGLRLLP